MTFKVWSNGCPRGSVSPPGLEPRTWAPNPEPSLCVYLFIYSHWGHKSLGPSSQRSDICARYTVMTECGRGDLKQSCRARSEISPKCCAGGFFFFNIRLTFSLNPEGQKLFVRQVWLIIIMFRVCFCFFCGDLSQIFNFSSVVKAAVRKSNSRICKIQNDVLFPFDLPQRTFKKTTTLSPPSSGSLSAVYPRSDGLRAGRPQPVWLPAAGELEDHPRDQAVRGPLLAGNLPQLPAGRKLWPAPARPEEPHRSVAEHTITSSLSALTWQCACLHWCLQRKRWSFNNTCRQHLRKRFGISSALHSCFYGFPHFFTHCTHPVLKSSKQNQKPCGTCRRDVRLQVLIIHWLQSVILPNCQTSHLQLWPNTRGTLPKSSRLQNVHVMLPHNYSSPLIIYLKRSWQMLALQMCA